MLVQCTALAHLNLSSNRIGAVGQEWFRSSWCGQASFLLLEWQEQEEEWEDEEEDEDEDEVLVLGVLVRRSRSVYYFLRSLHSY